MLQRQLVLFLTVFCALVGAGVMARADLRFSQPEMNAGEVRSGVPLTQRFAFINAGTETVEITGLQGSCGCLMPRLTLQTVRPGEGGAVLLDVNTLDQAAGPHNWRVRVSYRWGSETQETTLVLNATIVAEITVRPAALTVFADSAVSHEIVVTDFRPKPITIVTIKPTSPCIDAQLAEPSRDAKGNWICTIKVKITGALAEGQHHEAIHLFTDDPTYASLKVPVTVVKRPRQRVTTTPDQVVLTVPVGQPIPSRLILVRDRDNQPVVIDKVVADNPALRCTWSQGAHAPATVKVHFDRSQIPDGTLRGSVEVHVSQPVPQVLTIPVALTLE